MEKEADILELRFVGNHISPSVVKPREIAELVISFEKALLSDIKERHPEIDITQLLFSFEEIKDESLGIRFNPQLVKDIVVSSFTIISTSFQTGDFTSLNNDTITELRSFSKFSKKYQCAGEFNKSGVRLSTFSPTTEIEYNKNPIIKEDINLFGRVVDSGGDNPNVHLKINDETTLIFSTTEAIAKQLAHKLYEKVSLFGTAKWDAVTYKIVDFKVKEIIDFKAGNTLKAINELRNISSGYWDKFNTNEDLNNELLRD